MNFNDKQFSQIRIYRNSGRPVNVDDEQIFLAEWRVFYDKAASRASLNMEKMERYLSFGSYCLEQKLCKPVYVSSFKELADLHVQVGFPLLFGIHATDLELLAIIQDVGANE